VVAGVVERDVEEALQILELVGGLSDERRQQVLWLAETLAEWQQVYGN
jgi:hypothetical protein